MNNRDLSIGSYILDSKFPERGMVRIMRLTCGNDYRATYNYNKAFEHTPKDVNDLIGVELTPEVLKEFGFVYEQIDRERHIDGDTINSYAPIPFSTE